MALELPEDVLHGGLAVKHEAWVEAQVKRFQKSEDVSEATTALWKAAKQHRKDGHKEAMAETAAVLVFARTRRGARSPDPFSAEEAAEMDSRLREAVYTYLSCLAKKRLRLLHVFNDAQDRRAIKAAAEQVIRWRDALAPSAHAKIVARKGPRFAGRFPRAEENRRFVRLARTMYSDDEWEHMVHLYGLNPHAPIYEQVRCLLQPSEEQLKHQICVFAGTPDFAQALTIVHRMKGGSQVMRHRSKEKEGIPMYLGIVAGSPPGSFPVWHDHGHVVAALNYSRKAFNPERLKKAISILFEC